VRLSEREEAILAGEEGRPRRFALEQQLAVGRFYDAGDFVEITQAHVMGDGEALGEAGVELIEGFVADGPAACRCLVPTVTDPRGVDAKSCRGLGQPPGALERERRIVAAFEAMGIMMTDTCINYQTIMPPLPGEHLAFGDTGSVIYANSVAGARSNFEGGAAALWAALTGRVPRYGYHLPDQRRGTRAFRVEVQPKALVDWGVLGGVIGRRLKSYWEVPVLLGIESSPGSDALKHFGAALASYGSTPLFHIAGITPEAPDEAAAFQGPVPVAEEVTPSDVEAFFDSFALEDPAVDLVVFAAPQLSLFELRSLAALLDGKRLHEKTALLAATSPEIARAAERMGLTARIEAAGGRILEGVCFYQSYAREMGEANNWRRLVTNSAKLANIIGGYGYQPALASMERCVAAAVEGRLK
jgi:predicted aconitase